MGSVVKNSSRDRGRGNSTYAYLQSRMHIAEATLYRGIYFHRLDVTVLGWRRCSPEICYNMFILWPRNN